MIVQELTRLQREHGYLRQEDVAALAERTGVPLFRWHEVASFFPHFRTTPPPKVAARVCRDMSCRLRGSCDLLESAETLAGTLPKGDLHVEGVSCLGRCDRAPAALVNEHLYVGRTAEEFTEALRGFLNGDPPHCDYDADLPPHADNPWLVDPYKGRPSYEAVKRYVTQYPPNPDKVIKALETAGLLGMGGAGGRAYKKWEDVKQAQADQKYVVCNADESEPGTFKDRDLLLRTPWLILEGMILGGLVVGADKGYVYVRHEYEEQIEAVKNAIEQARAIGACGESIFGSQRSFDLEVFVSPGGYICGEQTALIQAMEDHRAEPRNRPPQLQTNGLWDKPTLLNNVETFAWAPIIRLKERGKWFADAGRDGFRGRRFFSISGDVNKPGAYEVANGITLRELINEFAGGVRNGKTMKALAASGPSGGFLPAMLPISSLRQGFVDQLPPGTTHFDLLDWRLDIGISRKMGLMLGAGMVVYAEDVDLVDQAWACSQFYRDESCGKCVPCRLGSHKLTEMLERIKEGELTQQELAGMKELVDELAQTMAITSICGLGQVAAAPFRTLLAHFYPEAEARVQTAH